MFQLLDCTTLDEAWTRIVTEPAQPVRHGVEVALTCEAGYINNGGNKAICRDGEMVPTGSPPQCSVQGKSKYFY